MAEPQFPLFDAIGRSEVPQRSDRGLLVRLGAYLVQVAAIGACLALSSTGAVAEGDRWLLLGVCGLVAVGSGFVLIWPLARAVSESLVGRIEGWARPTRRLWVAGPPVPERPAPGPRESGSHLRLVWDRERDGDAE